MKVYEDIKRALDESTKIEGQCELIMNALLAQDRLNSPAVDKVASVLSKWKDVSPVEALKELEDFQRTHLMTCSVAKAGANVPDGQMQKKWVGVKEMASMLGVAENWLYQRTRLNTIPHKKVGKYLRFDPDEIMAFLEKEQKG